jgi:hypothetical protein
VGELAESIAEGTDTDDVGVLFADELDGVAGGFGGAWVLAGGADFDAGMRAGAGISTGGGTGEDTNAPSGFFVGLDAGLERAGVAGTRTEGEAARKAAGSVVDRPGLANGPCLVEAWAVSPMRARFRGGLERIDVGSGEAQRKDEEIRRRVDWGGATVGSTLGSSSIAEEISGDERKIGGGFSNVKYI